MISSCPSGPISPTTAAILVVPISRPTMMSEDFLAMEGPPDSHRVSAQDQNFLLGRRRRGGGVTVWCSWSAQRVPLSSRERAVPEPSEFK